MDNPFLVAALILVVAALIVIASAELGFVRIEGFPYGGLFGDEVPDDGGFAYQSQYSGLYGTITDPYGAPLHGAYISLYNSEFAYINRTSEDGRYNITDVVPGTYTLFAEKEGYDGMKRYGFTIAEGYSYEWNAALKTSEKPDDGLRFAGLHGRVVDTKSVPLEGAFILLIGDSNHSGTTDADGMYNITGVSTGEYSVMVGKQGYKNASSDISMLAGHSYTWNFTIPRDCLYYEVNASVNYVVRYGREQTIYKGYATYTLAYPEGATYDVFPEEDGSLSTISTAYRAGNRMLSWRMDNSAGRYAYVQGHLFIDLKGTQRMRLFNNRNTSISAASASQPGYIGAETGEDGRVMIDPYHSEIRMIAEGVRDGAESDDAWTVAEALFVWLKGNTSYYHGPDSEERTQSAAEMLRSRAGDCDELSYLYLSMLRAVGIPSRFVDGYMVESNPSSFIGHQWVEFYDGEWVPVEVASSEILTEGGGIIRGESGNVTHQVDMRFGISIPNHVRTFVDDGTSQSMPTESGKYLYYDAMPSFSPSIYYDMAGYDRMYIAACADGTRTLVNEKG